MISDLCAATVVTVLVAAIQMECAPDTDRNRARAEALVREAAAEGAALVALPELFASLAPGPAMREHAERLDGPTGLWASALAAELGIWFLAGSFVERGDDDRLFNTSCLFGPDGRRRSVYRKIHLFDVEVPGAGIHESLLFGAGDEIVVSPMDGAVLGLTVCYDLRFPELFRIQALQGATMVALPSAFTAATGPDHWEPLVRARAIENQVFVVAPGQCGTSADGIARHGHSLIVDPWGRVLADGGDDEGVVLATCDPAEVDRSRQAVPSLENRRPNTYRWP
jgi:deaminated glutathione amidase